MIETVYHARQRQVGRTRVDAYQKTCVDSRFNALRVDARSETAASWCSKYLKRRRGIFSEGGSCPSRLPCAKQVLFIRKRCRVEIQYRPLVYTPCQLITLNDITTILGSVHTTTLTENWMECAGIATSFSTVTTIVSHFLFIHFFLLHIYDTSSSIVSLK